MRQGMINSPSDAKPAVPLAPYTLKVKQEK